MQYVRSISGSVSKTWNSINPATLSGAIDVVVVEREDGPQPRSAHLLLTFTRDSRLLALPRSIRQIPAPETVGQEGPPSAQVHLRLTH
jgi:hypothetical protein